uniref:Uncharacterized protein n=1 Tax=Pararge aegeria TaxID=116150 RepID=S4PW70_9NEOP
MCYQVIPFSLHSPNFLKSYSSFWSKTHTENYKASLRNALSITIIFTTVFLIAYAVACKHHAGDQSQQARLAIL